MNDERIINLEIKVAYLEKTMGDLDRVLRDVGDAVDVMRRELVRLRSVEMDSVEKPAVEKPPHY